MEENKKKEDNKENVDTSNTEELSYTMNSVCHMLYRKGSYVSIDDFDIHTQILLIYNN